MLDELMDIYKLKNIIRYNTRMHIKNESVAEHSFYVALIGLKLCDKYNVDEDTTRKVLIKALLHDMPEIEINDITHDAKEKLGLRPFLEHYEKDYFNRKFAKHANLMNKSFKNSAIVNTIVDLADAYSVVQYVSNEILLGNNSNDMTEILAESTHRTEKYVKKLKRLIGENNEQN